MLSAVDRDEESKAKQSKNMSKRFYITPPLANTLDFSFWPSPLNFSFCFPRCKRSLFDTNDRLWGSWTMVGPTKRAFFAGQSDLGGKKKEDFTILKLCAYSFANFFFSFLSQKKKNKQTLFQVTPATSSICLKPLAGENLSVQVVNGCLLIHFFFCFFKIQ